MQNIQVKLVQNAVIQQRVIEIKDYINFVVKIVDIHRMMTVLEQ